MYLDYKNEQALRYCFLNELKWFEEELDLLFNGKTHNYSENDLKIANEILDRMTETINNYGNENLLYLLTKFLCNIENKYPILFQE
ncbi:MAG: hypothetical protein GF317_02885 [Candidatus Lokiarchaeota archaeon]|nr:hypothetical protein [Candidatus Lokiarchaeota archaeon]MBD3198852.1 hypothetical protein [Candidatus Lokiarchaeota archaeon]